MEKVVYVLLGLPGAPSASLLGELREAAGRLQAVGARNIQLNVVDAALGPPFGVAPPPEVPALTAAVSAWVDCAGEGVVAPMLPVPLDGARWWGYLVSEAEPLPNTTRPPGEDGRVPGFAQLVLLRRPEGLTWAEWRARWQVEHTALALATQSTFRYVQNLVVRSLEEGAPAYDAVVEECFPLEAATDLAVFFAAAGDESLLAEHMRAMSESCDRFMDGAVPTAWTAEYLVGDF